jgi:mevalonate kinase
MAFHRVNSSLCLKINSSSTIKLHYTHFKSVFVERKFDEETISSFSRTANTLFELPLEKYIELIFNGTGKVIDMTFILVSLELLYQKQQTPKKQVKITPSLLVVIYNRFLKPYKLAIFYKRQINLMKKLLAKNPQAPILLQLGYYLNSRYIALKEENNYEIVKKDLKNLKTFEGGSN